MSKMIDKQALLDHVNECANYMFERGHIGVSGVFVILRDEIESGRFDVSDDYIGPSISSTKLMLEDEES